MLCILTELWWKYKSVTPCFLLKTQLAYFSLSIHRSLIIVQCMRGICLVFYSHTVGHSTPERELVRPWKRYKKLWQKYEVNKLQSSLLPDGVHIRKVVNFARGMRVQHGRFVCCFTFSAWGCHNRNSLTLSVIFDHVLCVFVKFLCLVLVYVVHVFGSRFLLMCIHIMFAVGS